MRGKLHGTHGVLVLAILLGSSLQSAAAPPGCTFLGDEFVRIGNGSTIDGDLGANRAGGFAHLGRRVELADGTTVSGETVDLLPGTSVFDVLAGTLDRSRGVTVRGTVTTATFPRVTPFCPTPLVTCGGSDVRVEKNGSASLPPGSYGRVTVENGGALGLAAGAYTFCSLHTGRNAAIAIHAGGTTAIAVADELVLENGSALRPDTGAPLPEIVVAGDRLKLGAGTQVEAFIVAGPARATVGRGATLVGAICAETLSTARSVALRCAAGPPVTTSTAITTTSTSTTTAPPVCGNGELDPGEQCDPGSPGGAFLLCEGRSCTPACVCEQPPPTSSTSTTVPTTSTIPTTSTSTVITTTTTSSSSTTAPPPTTSSTSTTVPTTSTSTVPTTTSTSSIPTTSSTTLPTTSTTTTVPTTSSTSTVPTTSSTSTIPTTSSTSTLPTTSSTSTLPTTTSSTITTTTTAVPTTLIPTTTTSSTSTTTITFPLNCGNGQTNTGETCDDGNNSDNDACPSDCRIDACTPLTTTQRFVQVRFAPPEGGLVAGLTMLLDYPEGSVDLPGNGTTIPSGTISGVPTGAFVSVNDLNFNQKGHAVRLTVGAGAALPPGQVVRLRFNDCQGATVPAASAFRCTVLTASDPFLNAVNGVTCSAVVE